MNSINSLRVKTYYFERLLRKYLSSTTELQCGLDTLSLSLELENTNTVLPFVGLSRIHASSAKEAYALVIEACNNAENVIIPAFTPSFRRSGVYSILYSRPEIGAFAKIAHGMSFSRTADPIHSFYIAKGNLNLDVSLRDTFHPDGQFKALLSPGTIILNIGTPYIVSTTLHYIERLAMVPYLEKSVFSGHVIHKDGFVEEVSQETYRYSAKVTWNRRKIERLLLKYDLMKLGVWNGAICRIIDSARATEVLLFAIKKDPYFLVTF